MFLKLYAIALPIFFALDMLWLGVIAKNFYRDQIGHLMKTDINWMAALIFYCVFIAGLLVFVVQPAFKNNAWADAMLFGALFGFICYATYDLTNLAVAKDWPLFITMVDLVWGALLSASVSTATYFIAKNMGF